MSMFEEIRAIKQAGATVLVVPISRHSELQGTVDAILKQFDAAAELGHVTEILGMKVEYGGGALSGRNT